MSETRWTPGPWVLDRNHAFAGRDMRREVANGFNVSGEGWHGLAVVFTSGSDPADPDGRANAHLIATSPRLYRALERLLAAVMDQDVLHGVEEEFDEGLAALAQARGESASTARGDEG